MVSDVTIITAIYGDKYDEFIPGWQASVGSLIDKPARVMCGTDRPRDVDAEILISESTYKWRSPYYWNYCAERTDTEWIWILDIDDRIRPDATQGLNEQTCDIWLMGMSINGREDYYPPRLTNEQIGSAGHCYFCCSTPIRRSWWQRNPYRDLAFTDWAMWRTSAKLGAHFEWSNKIGYDYRHDFANSMSGWADADDNNRLAVLAL